MVNNSERSKQWRSKQKNDPQFLENERKRKQESRKKRTEEQRKRDRELCKARQRKYRKKRRKLMARSDDITDDEISDSSDVSGPVLDGDAMDTDSVSSIAQSQNPVILSSVSKALNNRSSSICGQLSDFCDQEHRSEDDNVVVALKVSDTSGSVAVSDYDLQPNENGEDETNLKPLNDVKAKTGGTRNGGDKNNLKPLNDVKANTADTRNDDDKNNLKPLYDVEAKIGGTRNQLQHPGLDTSYACGKLTSSKGVVQTQVSRDVMNTVDGNSSRLPSKILAASNNVLLSKEENRRAIDIVSNSDSSSDDMEQQVESASEQPNKSTSETDMGKAGNEQPFKLASKTSTCISGNVRGISEQGSGHVFEANTDSVGNMEGRVSQPKESASNSSLTGKKTTKWIHQYAEGDNHEVVSFLTNAIPYPVVSQREAFFVRLQRELYQIADFDELKSRSGEAFRAIERRYPIPAIPTLRLFGHQRDVTASNLYPQDAPRDHVPIQILGDGNCLPRVGSLFAFGNDKRHHEIRVRIFIELCLFEDTYLNDSYLNRGLETDKQMEKTATLIAQYSDVFTKDLQGHDRDKYVYRVNAKKVLISGSYNGMWSVFALASVIGVGVRSIYPDYGGYNVREDHNRMVIPRVSRNNDTVIHIMWTNTLGKQPLATVWTPNHFVAVVHKSVIDDTPLRANGGTSEGKHLEQCSGLTRTGAYNTESLGLARYHGTLQPQTIARFTTRENNKITVTPSLVSSLTEHPLIGGPITRNKDTCLSHPSEKPVYLCNSCKSRPICYKCPLEGHKNHEYEDLELHLKKKEGEYLMKALRKRTSVIQTELNRQKDVNERSKGNIARQIDERVALITQQLQRWRQQCHQKLEDDAQAIHNNIALSGLRVSATIPTYLRNVQQQLRQLNMAERLARMSEDSPPDIAVNANPCTSILFSPGNDDQLIQQFGSLSCTLPDPINTSAEIRTTNNILEGNNTFSDICNSLSFNPRVRSVQSYDLVNPSNRTATKRSDKEDMDDGITTSRDLPSCSTSDVESNINVKQLTDTKMGSNQNDPTQSKRPRVMQSVVINTEPKQKLETSPNESVINERPRPCTAPIVSASFLNTRAGPKIIDNAEVVQQVDRPSMVESLNLTQHQIDVDPRLTCIQSSGIGVSVRPMPIKSCSETRVPVGQRIITSPDPTGCSGMQSSDEHRRRVEINQASRSTKTLGARATIPDNAITSQPRTTDKVTTATCLARAQPCGIMDSGASQKVKSIGPSRTTATTQKTSEKLVAGGRKVAAESLNNSNKADQISTWQPIVNNNVDGTTKLVSVAIASPVFNINVDATSKITDAVGTATLTNVNFTGATNANSEMETTARIPNTNMNVSGATKNTSAEQMTNVKFTRIVNAANVAGPIRMTHKHTTGAIKTEHVAGTSQKTSLNIEGPGKINDTMETTLRGNNNVSEIIKTVSRPSPVANNHVNGTNAVETALTIANKNTSGAINNIARTSPIARINANGTVKITNAEETMPTPSINFTGQTNTLNGAKTTSLTNKVVNGLTKITNPKGMTPVVNNNVAGTIKAVYVARETPVSNINVDGSTKITDAVGTIRNPYIKSIGSPQTIKVVEPTSMANEIVNNATKIANATETPPVKNRNVNKTRTTPMSNTNVNGTTKITQILGTAPMVDKSDTRTIRSVNILRSTPVPKRKRSTKIRNKEGTTPESYINFTGVTKPTKKVNMTSSASKDVDCSAEITDPEGTIRTPYINITGATKTATEAEPSSAAKVNVITTTTNVAKPTHKTAGPSNGSQSKRELSLSTDNTAAVRRKQVRTRSAERKVLCNMDITDNATEGSRRGSS